MMLVFKPFVGEARRVVLQQLGNRYRRHFGDVWEFVAYGVTGRGPDKVTS